MMRESRPNSIKPGEWSSGEGGVWDDRIRGGSVTQRYVLLRFGFLSSMSTFIL